MVIAPWVDSLIYGTLSSYHKLNIWYDDDKIYIMVGQAVLWIYENVREMWSWIMGMSRVWKEKPQ